MDTTRTTNLKEWFVKWLKREQKYEKFYALKDVNLEVERGDVLGIVGRNGSGKSTLLKVISGIYKPTAGRAVSAGRVAPMLELGSGFDPELTGVENIYLNGAILGFDEKHLQEKYDEILAFSELGEFIYQPLKTYSSGMVMRLAFSVATMVEPEILIVDEILAVGDPAFQRKSFERMMQIIRGGTTVLFVSHNMEQIRELCTKVMWLDRGQVKDIGPMEDVCDRYEAAMEQE
jgi:ABC-type polysaccharide/polyol phosphate transport system ATPase subunit